VSAAAFPIQKGKPLPALKGGWRVQKYPFDRMAIGDSFFVPATQLPPSGVSVLRSSARSRGLKAAVRAEGNGFRCWRIA